ncbi:hypothetical protein Ahy_A04g018264 [Arachis hypogaea]|uniref:Uncharacterized protein n=1 Tax=Arachis hypogaea TaxID=3818 RepID=A0A445DD96_ARAHY|nr:hypothetical protein Ahy_A04g018264 [Arachis hypogaea]
MRRFSFEIICKFSFGMDLECFIPYISESKLVDRFDLASKRSNIGVVDNVVLEMIGQRRREMTITTTSLNKSDLLSRFMRSIEDDKYLRDIVINFLSMNWLRTS